MGNFYTIYKAHISGWIKLVAKMLLILLSGFLVIFTIRFVLDVDPFSMNWLRLIRLSAFILFLGVFVPFLTAIFLPKMFD